MKKLFAHILISFILIINLVLPISVFAADELKIEDFTQPKDQMQDASESLNFSVTFKAPINPQTTVVPNKYYHVYFQAYCVNLDKNTGQGTQTKMTGQNTGVTGQSGSHYILNNQLKTDVDLEGHLKPNKTLSWTLSDGRCPGSASALNWVLTQMDDKGNIVKKFDVKTFTFKEIKANFAGYYYTTIDGSGNYSNSKKFSDEPSCKTDSDTFISNNKTSSIIIACKWYNDIPPDYKKIDQSVSVNPRISASENNSIYKMLVPIGKLNRMSSTSNDPDCTEESGCISNNIGTYLNFIFKFAIGISAALAVIMLIINGITYMGDESIFGKTEAKKKMYSAIFGLLIALGAWALLNTINPALTGVGGINIDQASVEVETQPLTANDNYTEGYQTSKCPEGIVTANTVNGNIPICKSLQTQLIAMVAKAKSAGINLFGYGYRSKEKQEALRAQNCGGSSNIYNKNAKCKPLTAMPGMSMHENGFAVDFRCDNIQISTKTNKCFLWLKANANPPFQNLDAEPWHWSTTGR